MVSTIYIRNLSFLPAGEVEVFYDERLHRMEVRFLRRPVRIRSGVHELPENVVAYLSPRVRGLRNHSASGWCDGFRKKFLDSGETEKWRQRRHLHLRRRRRPSSVSERHPTGGGMCSGNQTGTDWIILSASFSARRGKDLYYRLCPHFYSRHCAETTYTKSAARYCFRAARIFLKLQYQSVPGSGKSRENPGSLPEGCRHERQWEPAERARRVVLSSHQSGFEVRSV